MAPKKDLIKYSDYFTHNIPSSAAQAFAIIAIGIVAGMISSFLTHNGTGVGLASVLIIGATAGILVISFPAFLTVASIKIIRRDMKMKHALFAVLAVCASYSIFIIADAAVFSVLRNEVLAYVILILANASLYGYWLIIGRIAVGQRRSAIFTAEIQPLLNLIMYLPFGGYLIQLMVPESVAIVKLFFGMAIFLIMGYAIFYLLDRPAKKKLAASSIEIFSAMVGQWLYNISADTTVLGMGGVEREISVSVAAVYAGKKCKAVFVKPDIHYGPFGNIGGSVFTETMSNSIISRCQASPFVMHGAVNVDDNLMSTNQSYTLSNKILDHVPKCSASARGASGYIKFGKDGPCRAIEIRMGDIDMVVLSKAPYVTEDIDRSVGLRLEKVAAASSGSSKVMLIDAHNSRFESAGKSELIGINKTSKYIEKYERAIRQAAKPDRHMKMRFGSNSVKLNRIVSNPDIGPGNTSLGIFEFGTERFGLLYIDANNMLPGFRSAVINHVKKKYALDIELCTTDTHAVNSIALPASNSLGRHTKYNRLVPTIDAMVEKAFADMQFVSVSYDTRKFQGVKVWGTGSEELLSKVGMDIINTGKHVVPFVIVAAYLVAAWIIYII